MYLTPREKPSEKEVLEGKGPLGKGEGKKSNLVSSKQLTKKGGPAMLHTILERGEREDRLCQLAEKKEKKQESLQAREFPGFSHTGK